MKAEDKMSKVRYFLAKLDTAHYLVISHYTGPLQDLIQPSLVSTQQQQLQQQH